MNDENLLAADEVLREVHRALLANGNTLQAAQVRAAAMEARALRVKLDACMASRDALRDWAQECRNKVLYLLAQQDNELGRVADGLGQASAGLFGPMMRPTQTEPSPATPPQVPIPESLLDIIGRYGNARSGGCDEAEIIYRWEELCGAIKQYVAAERERCASLVERRAGPMRTGAYDALISAAAEIRGA